MYGFKQSIIIIVCKRWNSFIYPVYGTIKDSDTPGQSEPENNGTEEVLHIL